MELIVGGFIFAAIFAVYDALRKINNNILYQTEEIKKLREEINLYEDLGFIRNKSITDMYLV